MTFTSLQITTAASIFSTSCCVFPPKIALFSAAIWDLFWFFNERLNNFIFCENAATQSQQFQLSCLSLAAADWRVATQQTKANTCPQPKLSSCLEDLNLDIFSRGFSSKIESKSAWKRVGAILNMKRYEKALKLRYKRGDYSWISKVFALKYGNKYARLITPFKGRIQQISRDN